MIKKLLLGTLIVGGVGLVFLGTDLYSYVKTSAKRVKQAVKENVSIDFDIDRAQDLVQELVPEIRTNMLVIAREESDLAQLNKQISDLEQRLAKDQEQLQKLKTDLSAKQPVFVYAGTRYTEDQVKKDLSNRFERFKISEATLASLREMQQVRQQSIQSSKQKLETMIATKRQLEVEVKKLSARLQIIEAEQAACATPIDESKLSRAKDLVSDINTRLDVAERMVHADTRMLDEIPVDDVVPENIVEQVTEYFATKLPAQVASTQVPANQ